MDRLDNPPLFCGDRDCGGRNPFTLFSLLSDSMNEKIDRKEYHRQYYLQHKEHHNKITQDYWAKHKKYFHKIGKEQRIKKKKEIKQKYYLNQKCSQCGSSDKLSYHHINSNTKLMDPIDAFSCNHLEEILKCIVLCDTCHKKLHANQRKRNEKGQFII